MDNAVCLRWPTKQCSTARKQPPMRNDCEALRCLANTHTMEEKPNVTHDSVGSRYCRWSGFGLHQRPGSRCNSRLKPAPSPRKPISTASRWSTTTASSTPISKTARIPNTRRPWNTLVNIPRVYTPADTAIQTPNSDTPYSFAGLDLRAEPFVLTVPPIEKDRYFSVQLIDWYTFNFDYIGSRATGNDGGSFLVAGPGWKGETPDGREEGVPLGDRVCVSRLSHAAFQSGRSRQREESPGRLQDRAALGVSRPARAGSRARDRFHQAADAGRREDVARVFQHPELRPAVLPDRSVRDRTDGAVRQDRDWRREDLRRQHALARNQDGHRTGSGRRLG